MRRPSGPETPHNPTYPTGKSCQMFSKKFDIIENMGLSVGTLGDVLGIASVPRTGQETEKL